MSSRGPGDPEDGKLPGGPRPLEMRLFAGANGQRAGWAVLGRYCGARERRMEGRPGHARPEGPAALAPEPREVRSSQLTSAPHLGIWAKGVRGKLEMYLERPHLLVPKSPSPLSKLPLAGGTSVPRGSEDGPAGSRAHFHAAGKTEMPCKGPLAAPLRNQPCRENCHPEETGPRGTGVTFSKEKQEEFGCLSLNRLQRDRGRAAAEEGARGHCCRVGEGRPPPG